MTVVESGTRLGRFAQVAQALNDHYGVSRGRPGNKASGRWALLVDDKIFAMSSVGGHFVVKLPKQRIDSLVNARAGQRLVRSGLEMEGWLVVQGHSAEHWLALAREALRFVRTLD